MSACLANDPPAEPTGVPHQLCISQVLLWWQKTDLHVRRSYSIRKIYFGFYTIVCKRCASAEPSHTPCASTRFGAIPQGQSPTEALPLSHSAYRSTPMLQVHCRHILHSASGPCSPLSEHRFPKPPAPSHAYYSFNSMAVTADSQANFNTPRKPIMVVLTAGHCSHDIMAPAFGHIAKCSRARFFPPASQLNSATYKGKYMSLPLWLIIWSRYS
jgi:hypothetical protein